MEDGWEEYKGSAKTTVGGAKNDEEAGKDEIMDVRSWEQPKTGDTPEGECGGQERPATLEETPFLHYREFLTTLEPRPDHPPDQKVVGQSRYVTISRVERYFWPS